MDKGAIMIIISLKDFTKNLILLSVLNYAIGTVQWPVELHYKADR